jgi:hypothetical protein
MKSSTLVTALTNLTTAMAVAAPMVVFGFLYVLQVQPERAAAVEARNQLAAARDELHRQRVFVRPQLVVTEASALDEFNARTTEGDGVGDMADALAGVLNGPAVAGVSNLSIDTGAPGDGPLDSMVRWFPRTVVHTPVTVTFDARYEQIGRFFWNLRVLPTTFDLQSVELTPGTGARAGLMRAKVSLLVFQRPRTAAPGQAPRPQMVDLMTTPEWGRDPFARQPAPAAERPVASVAPPAPVVSSILISGGRRIALVDGQVVRAGDRVRSGVVRAIEADAVVIADAEGRVRRFEIERAVIRMANR